MAAWISAWLLACDGGLDLTDYGDVGPDACEDFRATPQTSTSSDPYLYPCPGGGTVEDLVTNLRFVDAEGEPCDVCAPGPLTVELTVVNLCNVDVEVSATCLVPEWSLVRPDGTVESAIAGCVATETVYTVGSGETPWWSETLDADASGPYRLEVTLNGGLGTAQASFCVGDP